MDASSIARGPHSVDRDGSRRRYVFYCSSLGIPATHVARRTCLPSISKVLWWLIDLGSDEYFMWSSDTGESQRRGGVDRKPDGGEVASDAPPPHHLERFRWTTMRSLSETVGAAAVGDRLLSNALELALGATNACGSVHAPSVSEIQCSLAHNSMETCLSKGLQWI